MPVFPTHVGVFLSAKAFKHARAGFPHARGGVSDYNLLGRDVVLFSPRTWGCFLVQAEDYGASGVFPTHVGVFLLLCARNARRSGFPHARGGVSTHQESRLQFGWFSPRTWGVFPKLTTLDQTQNRFPHARGGV